MTRMDAPQSGVTLYHNYILEIAIAKCQRNNQYNQESMKVREVIPHIGPIPIVIPLKLFLDLLRDPVFPRGLTDSQSYVSIFANDANHCMRIHSAVKIGENRDI